MWQSFFSLEDFTVYGSIWTLVSSNDETHQAGSSGSRECMVGAKLLGVGSNLVKCLSSIRKMMETSVTPSNLATCSLKKHSPGGFPLSKPKAKVTIYLCPAIKSNAFEGREHGLPVICHSPLFWWKEFGSWIRIKRGEGDPGRTNYLKWERGEGKAHRDFQSQGMVTPEVH